MKKIKKFFVFLHSIEKHIRLHITISRFFYYKIPFFGKFISLFLDRVLILLYGTDLGSHSVDVKHLAISHPVGVLLGGNGIFSNGRVAVMAGVKFVGHSPSNNEYIELHKKKTVFVLGDNVVIGSNSVLIGPIEICDNVLIGAMSLVNKPIREPGIYVGIPVKKISERISDEWFN